MTEPWLDSGIAPVEWNEENRGELHHFLDEVANTCLKIKILELFLYEPYLCLTSTLLADRVGETCEVVRDSVRELYARDSFLYCESFGYADICCLAFDSHSPNVQHSLMLLRHALRNAPEMIWEQVA